MLYAIVDIETTGGHADANGITEIAVIVHDGKKKLHTFHTLINPQVPIPRYISGLTGITDEMVSDAPTFASIAPQLYELLHDKFFVAHNVNFDYSFIHHQFKYCGIDWNTKKLCTVRLSRKIFPGYKSYSLGNICGALNITIKNRHRALGDAEATVKLFSKLLKHDKNGLMADAVKSRSKEQVLPPNLKAETFHQLPTTCGVYYFHDSSGKVIYVGKAINIKKRVAQHFSGNKTGKQRQDFLRFIHDISYTETATELMSLILESMEIKKHWPAFNRAQKKPEFVFGIYDYEDRNGYIRLCIDAVRKFARPLTTFKTRTEAHNLLQYLIDTFGLCAKLCMIDTSRDACHRFETNTCKGACCKQETADDYNARVNEAINFLQNEPSFAIVGKGLSAEENSCILIENGRFYGMGYLPSELILHNPDTVKMYIQPQKDNFFIRELIQTDRIHTQGKVVSFTT